MILCCPVCCLRVPRFECMAPMVMTKPLLASLTRKDLLLLASVKWENGHTERSVASEAELTDLLLELNELAARRPFIADVVIPSGDRLSIALGRDISVLSFRQASPDPPYFASEGLSPDSVGGFVNFDYFGSYSEFPLWQAISNAEAMVAVRQFATHQKLPGNVKWTEV